MASEGGTTCLTALATSLALIDQFLRSLQSSEANTNASANPSNYPSPLSLLKASAESLKSSVTKLSLLCITPPFTPTAVVSIVKPLNDSILPSLVTATLLTSSSTYPDAFCAECRSLSTRNLSELKLLLHLVNDRAQDSKPKASPSNAIKKSVTEATGRVWEGCDSIVKFANDDVAGFVVKKAEQWLALMKDAVQELQEWDPEEEVDENDLFGDIVSEDGEETEVKSASERDADRAAISAGVKDQALKVLSRIPQSIHVVIKQRLAKIPIRKEAGLSVDTRRKTTLDQILKQTRSISENIDESAEGMYMGNLELCLRKAGEARATTIEVLESVLEPWDKSNTTSESKEDLYIKRALLWIQQVDPGGAKLKAVSNTSGGVVS